MSGICYDEEWKWDPSSERYYKYGFNDREKRSWAGTLWNNPSGPEWVPRTAPPIVYGQLSGSPPTGNHTYSSHAGSSGHTRYDSGTSQPSVTVHTGLSVVAQGTSYSSTSYEAEASASQQLGDAPQAPLASLPLEIYNEVRENDPRRFIRTGTGHQEHEALDHRYKRVRQTSQQLFFVTGRVFKMLWTEPAGQVGPGKSRDGTHFSLVRFGETAYSEIRRFVVIRNCGTFSQCIPIHTYRGQGALKPNINTQAHGMIHTINPAPSLLEGEVLSKHPIYVMSSQGEQLEPESRVNYGKPYAVEHNVKVLDIGQVWDRHVHMLQGYFQNAIIYGS